MKNVKRILIGFIVFEVVMLAFNILISVLKEKEYKYITLDNEWGISNKCYLDENQYAICMNGYDIIQVRQFYEA